MEVTDIGAIVPLDSITYEVLKPGTQIGSGWKIDIAYVDHPKAQAWVNESARKGAKRQAAIEAQQLNGRKIKPDERDPEEQRRDNIAWVCSRVIGWTPVKIDFISPEPLAYSDENATKVLGHAKMGWVVAQLIDVIGDERSFTKPSQTA